MGLLPTPAELDQYVNDASPNKRDKLIDRLLADRLNYADHWLTFWNDLLRNAYQGTGFIDGGRKQITGWLYESLLINKPYDQFVRELIEAAPVPKVSHLASNGGARSMRASDARFKRPSRSPSVPRNQHQMRELPR